MDAGIVESRRVIASRELRRAFRTAWDHLVLEDAPTPSDAIFCFGSRHWRVPERAAALYRLGVAPTVVVTGGPSQAGAAPEADIFAARLVDAGVPADRIVVEPHARHTGENVDLGMAALGRRTDAQRLTLVSWPLAARRCRATFERHHPHLALSSAPALRRPGHRWRPTLRRVRFALGELDRLDRYAALGFIASQPTSPELDRAVARLSALDPRAADSAQDALVGQVEASGPVGKAQAPSLLLGEG